MIHYIIQTIAFQVFFLLVYDVFLKKETFFNWNRVYLLGTAVLSLILPLIKIDSFKKVILPNYIISLPKIIIDQSSKSLNNIIVLDTVVLGNDSLSFWEILFYTGVFVAFCLFLIKVIKISVMVIKNPRQSIGKVVLVELLNSTAAFSFFHYIFLGEYIKTEDKDTILKHELIHTEQKHTLDLLFFEVLRIVFWFNPFVYMYQNRLATLHEFIADANALKHQDKEQYYQNLLAQVFETQNISFINTFFNQSLIKKRIVMLEKSKSKQIHLFKYGLLIPMVLGMLVYTSCENQDESDELNSIDLSQYSYSIKKGGEEMSVETKMIHDKYEAFLKANPNYVAWAKFDYQTKTVSYSVHLIDEKRPNEYGNSPWEVSFKDGKKYKMFTNFNNSQERKKSSEAFLNKKEEYENASDVPFSVIDESPIFPGCEELAKEEQKKCLSNNITQHVSQNFNTKVADSFGLKGRQRISVMFKINDKGNIIDVESRAPHLELEKEAIRVIKTLPKMIPGKQRGKEVNVPYSLPIIFQVTD